MLFNSIFFLLVFLPLAWGGFHLCAAINHRLAMGWIVVASLLFYGWWTPAYLILLCGSIMFNYLIGVWIQNTVEKASRQGIILAFGVGANLLLLGYFKYLFPFLHWVELYCFHRIPSDTSVILPLGISFFTFTQIGYLVDCKAGLTSGRRFLDYALFVSFFPHLIAGPILHHREMMPQYENADTWRFNPNNIAIGLTIFFIGLVKKDFVADYFAISARFAFEHSGNLTTAQAWEGVLSYSMQLYFDFSGYTDMAIGLALLFNIHFPANFDSPYKSTSIIDFWQRWHMTLTRYLNLYLYNPIALWVTRGRMRKNLPVGRPGLKTVPGFLAMVAFPTFVTMILIGVWHGAGFQFVIFGLLHALYLTINHIWRLLFHKKNAPSLTRYQLWFSTAWKVVLTYSAVLVGQIFFRAPSTAAALSILANMGGFHARSLVLPNAASFKLGLDLTPLTIVLALVFVWTTPNVLQIFRAWQPTLSSPRSPGPEWYQALEWKPTPVWAVAMGLLASLAILAISGQTEFLYFKF